MANKYDLDKIRKAYEEARDRAQAERYSYERDWFRNVLYYLGVQWIVYNSQTRKWAPRQIKHWVPRPVTNKFAAIANTVMQVLTARTPETRAIPETDSPDDVATANVADRNFDVILKEMDADYARKMASAWIVLTGTAFFHPCYDKDKRYGTTFIQHLKCNVCGTVFAPDQAGPPRPIISAAQSPSVLANQGSPQAQGPGMEDQSSPLPAETQLSDLSCPNEACGSANISDAIDETGAAIGEELPNGKMKLEVFSPFEIFIDPEVRSMDDVQEILVRRRYPLEVIKRQYDRYDLEADNNTSSGTGIGLNLLRAIAYASGNANRGGYSSAGRTAGDDQNITVDQLWVRPSKDFPEGLVATYAHEQLLSEEEAKAGLPYRKRNGEPIWNWHVSRFDMVPGRLFGRTPMDDAAPKQEQRNKLESLIQLIITRDAAPHWLIPKNLGVAQITGEPGQTIEYNAHIDPRLRPEKVPGGGIQTSLIAWLEKIDNDMDAVVGTYEVLKGNAPSGVTAGTALRLLLERANTRFTPTIKDWEDVWGKVCNDALIIFQQNAGEDRINRIQGPGNTWEVERFSKADLSGNINIIVEAGSAIPKSQVGEQALIQDMATMGVINPQDSQTQYKILEKFGSTNLLGDVDKNIRYAQRENWNFMHEKIEPTLTPLLDAHAIHSMVHKQLALTSDFAKLPEQMRIRWLNHIFQHEKIMMPPVMPIQAEAPGNGNKPKTTNAQRETAQDANLPPSIQ